VLGASTVEDELKFWRLKEWLSIDEASSLAFGCNPSDMNASKADGYGVFHSALTEAVKTDLTSEFMMFKITEELMIADISEERRQTLFNDVLEHNKALSFSVTMVEGYKLEGFHGSDIGDMDKAQIKVIAFKKWLMLKGISPPFFFPEKVEQLDDLVSIEINHVTPLMSIMNDTIKRYYGQNYDSNDKDTAAKQVDVIQWLMESYNSPNNPDEPLSKAEAMAVDKMTRPKKLIP